MESEHAAFLHVRSPGRLGADWLWQLECDLRACLDRSAAGELAGAETTAEEWIAFAYGPNAEHLVLAVHEALGGRRLPEGSYVAWRRGGLEAPEERQDLGAAGCQCAHPAPALTRMTTLRPRHLLAALALRGRDFREWGGPADPSSKN